MPDKFFVDTEGLIRVIPEGTENDFLSHFPEAREATRKELADYESRVADIHAYNRKTDPGVFHTGNEVTHPGKQAGKTIPDTRAASPWPTGQPMVETMKQTRAKTPVSIESWFDMAADSYKSNRDRIKEVENDPELSEWVKDKIKEEYHTNIRVSDNTGDEKDLPPAAHDWLERNKKPVKKRWWVPANFSLGQPGYWEEYTEYENTPEQIEFITDFLTNSADGRTYRETYTKQIEELEGLIEPLLKKGHSLREKAAAKVNEENRELGVESSLSSLFGNREISLTGKAIHVLKQTQKLLDAKKNGKGFWKGLHMSKEDIAQFATFSEFLNDAFLNQVINKYEKDPGSLTEEEQLAIQAKYVADQMMALVDPGSWYNIGASTKESLPFMRDFILTSGVGGGVSGLAKGGLTKALGGGMKKGILSKGAAKGLGTAAHGALDLSLRPAVQTFFSPSGYAMALKEMHGFAIDRDENGRILFDGRQSFGHGLTSAFIENHSEMLGEVVLDKLLQKFHIPLPAFLKTNATKKLAQITGIQGPISEFGEEKYADLLNLLRGEQTIEEFFDPRQNRETFGAVAVMQIPFSAFSMVGYGIAKAKEIHGKRAIRALYDQNREHFNATFQEDAPAILEMIHQKIDSGQQVDVPGIVREITDSYNLSAIEKHEVAGYVMTYAFYAGVQKANSEEVEQLKAEIAKQIQENINLDMNALISVNVVGMDAPVTVVKGRISRFEDGSVNRRESDKSLVVIDTNKSRQVVSIQEVESIDEFIFHEEAIRLFDEGLVTPATNQLDLEELPEYTAGRQVVTDMEGVPVKGTLVEQTPEGFYKLQLEDGSVQVVAPRQIRQQESPQENNKDGADIEQLIARAPRQENGSIDYEALLAQSPEAFTRVWEQEFGTGQAHRQVEQMSAAIGKEIETLEQKLEKETGINKKAALLADIRRLAEQKEQMDGILENRETETAEQTAKQPIIENNELEEQILPTEENEERNNLYLAEKKESDGRRRTTFDNIRTTDRSQLRQKTLGGETEQNDGSLTEKADRIRTGHRIGVWGGNTLLTRAIPVLEPEEFSHVERVFTENNYFSFTAPSTIESIDDIVYIFGALENKSIENAFIVYIKNGQPTVQHLTIGKFDSVSINFSAIHAAYNRLNPDQIYLVHNHPSGEVYASNADQYVHMILCTMYGEKVMPGIIINLRTGKYGVFDSFDSEIAWKKGNEKEMHPIPVYMFDEQVFDENYDPASLITYRNNEDIASFIAGHRLGKRKKMNVLLTNTSRKIVGNFFTRFIEINEQNLEDVVRELTNLAITYGGNKIIPYGNFSISPELASKFQDELNLFTQGEIELLQIIQVSKEENISNTNNTPSDNEFQEKRTLRKNNMGENSFPAGESVSLKDAVMEYGATPEQVDKCHTTEDFINLLNQLQDERRKRISERVSQGTVREGNETGRKVEAKTTHDRGRETTTGDVRQVAQGKRSKEQQLAALQEFAREKGIWMDDTRQLGEQFSDTQIWDKQARQLQEEQPEQILPTEEIEERNNSYLAEKTETNGREIPNSEEQSNDGRQLSFDFQQFDRDLQRHADSTGKTEKIWTGPGDLQWGSDALFRRKRNALKPGEFSHVERIFTKNNHFSFTAPSQIKSIEDIVYIFQELENESVENAFVVFVKDGIPIVQHLGMGAFYSISINFSAIHAACSRINPDQIYMVHNHPSGDVYASDADVGILADLKGIFGDIVMPGIIINLKTGKYGVYECYDSKEVRKSGEVKEMHPISVYSFSKQVFEEDYDPSSLKRLTKPEDIASFVAGHRLGERKKMNLLIINNLGKIVGNIFTPYIELTTENLHEAVNTFTNLCITYGGKYIIPYGNISITPEISYKLNRELNDFSFNEINLWDIIEVHGEEIISHRDKKFLEATNKISENITGETSITQEKDTAENISFREDSGIKKKADKDNQNVEKGENKVASDSQQQIKQVEAETHVSPTLAHKEENVKLQVAENIEEINKQFNDELQQQIDGKLPKGHIYKVGFPSSILRSVGIPDLSIEVRAEKLADKSAQENHPFTLAMLKDLPRALHDPIAIFISKTKPGTKVILTELHADGFNFVLVLRLNVLPRGFRNNIQINDIRSLYPKNYPKDIVNWINRGDLLEYAHENKILNWITQQQSNPAEVAIPKKDLDIATNIVKRFQNPKLQAGIYFRPIGKKKFQGLVDILRKTGLSKTVILDKAVFDAKLKEIQKNRVIHNKSGEILGFVTEDGTVYLDPSRMNANTPIHEFGHLWNSFIKQQQPPLYARGLELVRQSDYWQQVNRNPAYAHLTEEQKAEEALAMAIGDKGEAFVNRSLKQQFLDWLADLWKSVKNVFGFETDIAVEDLTLSDFTGLAVKDLLGGKRLTNHSVEASETNTQSDVSMEEVNRKFNEELKQQIDGTLPKGHYYHLGMPSKALQAAGFDYLPIRVSARKIQAKSHKDYLHSHPFELKEIHNLPEALANPIAVFASEEIYTDKKVILTELKNGKYNFIAVIDVISYGRNNEVNSIISLYPKNSNVRIAKWFLGVKDKSMDYDLLLWVDKEKASKWLTDNSSDVSSVGLSFRRIANVINSFENPKFQAVNNYNSEELSTANNPRLQAVEKDEIPPTDLKDIDKELKNDIREGESLLEYAERVAKVYWDNKKRIPQPEVQPQEKSNIPDIREGESLLDYAQRVANVYEEKKKLTTDLQQQIKQAEAETNVSPTPAQKEAGNYKKGHVTIQGLDISIEQPKGSVRTGIDSNGKSWETTLTHSYGYIRKTEGKDGEQIDVFIGNNPQSKQVFVVDQLDPQTGRFDEHKVMLGFDSLEEAREAYLSNYEMGWSGMGTITNIDMEEFRKWTETDGRRVKPFSDYINTRKQSSQHTFAPITKKAFNKLVNLLKKTGLAEYVITDKMLFDEKLKEVLSDNSTAWQIISELDSIKQKAIADGNFMLAPNGKRSNLNESQWLLIRTSVFKDWFGDWEKAFRIDKLKKSKPIIIQGNEYEGKYELSRDSIRRWGLDNLRGSYTIKDTAEVVEITKIGTKKVTSHSMGKEAHMKSIVFIPQIIEKAIFIEEIPNTKDNGKYDSYRYYAVGLNIEGVDYTAKVTVGVKNGKKYYDHALTKIEKGSLIDSLNAETDHVAINQETFLSEGKDTKLFSILQNFSSKAIDKNGEPLVVYPGKLNGVYYAIEPLHTNKKNNMNERSFFFTDKLQEEVADSSIQTAEKPSPVFISLSKPFVIDNEWREKNGWDAVWKEAEQIQADGIVINSTSGKTVVAFESSQVKLADENDSPFNNSTPDIRMQLLDQEKDILLMHNRTGEVYGFVTKDKKVYLNPKWMNANTPIHEFGHLWNSFIKQQQPQFYARGLELVRQSDYWQRVNRNPAYAHLTEQQKAEEALAMAIGDKGEAFVNRSLKQQFLDWLADLWKTVKNVFGFETDIAVEDLTLSDFTGLAVKDLLGGKQLPTDIHEGESLLEYAERVAKVYWENKKHIPQPEVQPQEKSNIPDIREGESLVNYAQRVANVYWEEKRKRVS